MLECVLCCGERRTPNTEHNIKAKQKSYQTFFIMHILGFGMNFGRQKMHFWASAEAK